MRGRPADTALAALATLAAVLALTTLVQSQAWLQPATGLVLLVAVVGFGLRQLAAAAALVVLGQMLAVGAALVWTFAPATTWYGIPTVATGLRFAELFRDFATTVYAAAAPLPTEAGVELVLPFGAAVVALLVDAVAVTCRAPAAAGLPLLAVFLTAAANSGSGLSLGYFLVVAVAWLALVAHHGRSRMRRWSTAAARSQSPAAEAKARLGFGAAARRLGVTAVLLALAVPAVLPHLPTRFLLDGLARGTAEAGTAKVGYSSTLDVSRSLEAGDTTEILTFTTTAPAAAPLRVLATATYDGTSWSRPSPLLGRASRLDLSPQVERVERVVSVDDNTLNPPALATPQPVVAADFRGASWSVDEATSDIYVQSRPAAYSTTYVEPVLTAALLRDGIDGQPGPDPLPTSRQLSLALRVDARSDARVRAAAAEATGSATNPYDVAMAIQGWLRSERFTYSLTLTPAPGSTPLDPLSQFLETRTGYCVQFATAMVMMSRAKGIPARMAIGFLPGARDPSGRYAVSADDAHAWPELYFHGAGWVRFEPTPSVRSGTAPQWTLPVATVAPSEPTEPGTAESSNPVTRDLDRGLDAGLDDSTGPVELPLWDRVRLWLADPVHLVLLGVLLGVLATLVLPVTALVLRWRRQRRTRDPHRAEAQWAGLTARLEDLGLAAPPGGTLRDAERYYRDAAGLDEDSGRALRAVVATVEQARYARPGTADRADLTAHVRTVARAAARSRASRQRLRAVLLPTEGRQWWHRAARHLSHHAGAVLRRPTEWACRRFGGR